MRVSQIQATLGRVRHVALNLDDWHCKRELIRRHGESLGRALTRVMDLFIRRHAKLPTVMDHTNDRHVPNRPMAADGHTIHLEYARLRNHTQQRIEQTSLALDQLVFIRTVRDVAATIAYRANCDLVPTT